ncbi:hypothetical protein ACODYM_28980 [Burkholderia gladioli]|uniref:hypothetical protein n=1 Tax=Burkholderia gladioli TaxID=28095 RepID=UPI003B511652
MTDKTTDNGHKLETIDITPTWGEIGLFFSRLAVSGETEAIRAARPDMARAFAAAAAFQALRPTLSEEQLALAATVMTAELTKQGY